MQKITARNTLPQNAAAFRSCRIRQSSGLQPQKPAVQSSNFTWKKIDILTARYLSHPVKSSRRRITLSR
ncbi:hypothetical protein [Sulfitobacter litoralis]|uniref:hypothetical protein n=1 Tax=Sulfitobacter litoralis TaxID=335975 RepID=UPI002B2664E9|nr:hypothetical protein [Sulfitobacter litoralis]